MRFRDHGLDFRLSTEDAGDEEAELLAGAGFEAMVDHVGTPYPSMSKTLQDSEKGTTFKLHVEAGTFREAEIIGLLGENGGGKTTFMYGATLCSLILCFTI